VLITYADKVALGRTGLLVSRVGIGCSYGIETSALLEAFDRGLNYFYFGTLRRAAMAKAVHQLIPAHREELIVAIQSYSRWPGVLRKSVGIALKKLRLQHADILILGKMDQPPSNELVEEIIRLRDSGKVRFLAISAHNRFRFRAFIEGGLFDIVMVRYNAAHTGAETEVFPHLHSENRPGVICYTATRWGTLLKSVPGERTATASDCYRFCLQQPSVDVCLSGPKNRKEMDEALRVLQLPPMTADELAWMRRIGTNVYKSQAHNFLLRKLIFD
jgi:aryl-alcohol dehydrogenase-like predicted oxidoreductase